MAPIPGFHRRKQSFRLPTKDWMFLVSFKMKVFYFYMPRQASGPFGNISDVNTNTYLNAYRRFTCRRCQPIWLYSDKGKTFVGTSEELMRSFKALYENKIYKALAAVKINRKFNPPHCPQFGDKRE